MTAASDHSTSHPCDSRRQVVCRTCYRSTRTTATPQALTEWASKQPDSVVLGGQAATQWMGGWSLWAVRPRHVFECPPGHPDPMGGLERELSRFRLVAEPDQGSSDATVAGADNTDPTDQTPGACPFRGGWIGFFSYDLGNAIEPIDPLDLDNPPDPAGRPQLDNPSVGKDGRRTQSTDARTAATAEVDCPWIRLAFYDRWIAWDHATDTAWLGVLECDDDPTPAREKFADLRRGLQAAEHLTASSNEGADTRPELRPIHPLEHEPTDTRLAASNMTRDDYIRTVEWIRQLIHDGQVYQVNFAQRLTCPYAAPPVRLMHWQNRYNPSPYAAFLQAPRFAVASASPELFLRVSDGWITTRPIKGTRPRFDRLPPGTDPALDPERRNRAARAELWASQKDRAELTMIVDLERNDLARICVPGTRHVVQERAIEEYATVYHTVATITGRLARPHGPRCLETILRATFPGGSITGAPKIRARQVIAATEPNRRGLYTGAIGWIGLDGALELNIAIRTVFIQHGAAIVHSGGGIVADSVATEEYEETLAKARALIAGIRACQSSGPGRPVARSVPTPSGRRNTTAAHPRRP